MAGVDNGLDPDAGFRSLSPANDLPWLTGTVAPGASVLEFSVPLSTLFPSGVPSTGAAVGITVKLLNDAYGVDYANQTLPEDSGTHTVAAVAVFSVYPAGEY
jgi:hypothetical protein